MQLDKVNFSLIKNMDAQDLIKKMLQFKPKARITLRKALLHPWMKKATDIEQGIDVDSQVDTELERVETEWRLRRNPFKFFKSCFGVLCLS